MKIALKLALFITLCGLAAIAHAKSSVQVDKAYNGGFSEPDVFIVQDTNRGVVCYLFEDGNGVSSSCFSQKDLKKKLTRSEYLVTCITSRQTRGNYED